MRKSVSIAAIIAIFSFSYSVAQDGQQSLAYYRHNTEYVLYNESNLVRQYLSPQEKIIQSSARIRVPADWAMVAQAYPGNIVISAGFTWVIEQLAISHIAENELGYDDCDRDYTLYLAESVADNSKRVKNGQLPRAVYGVEEYGNRIGGGCQDFQSIEITRSGNGDNFAAIIEASLMLVYLHELAHHVLHHVDNPPSDLDYSRQQEAAADAWAIKAGFRAKYNTLVGAPMMNLIAALGGASLEAEVKQTHPLGIRRVRDMLKEAREILVANGDDQAVEWLDDNLARIEARVPR